MYVRETKIFTAPGRTEICGNHTDHQNGIVLAASVNLQTTAVVAANADNVINITSQGFGCIKLSANDTDYRPEEEGTTISLVRGVLAGFKAIGCQVGGFSALVSSSILPGSGLSSSAAFEVLIGRILNELYNDNVVNDVIIARIGQFAENFWFGKPCGLMDQTASAVGGLVAIDFKQPARPQIELLDSSFDQYGHSICITNTGTSHADLTRSYTAITNDMKKVANFFGKETLRDVDETEFFAGIDRCGQKTGSIATLRAIHFFLEENRVQDAVFSLKCNEFKRFLKVINDSGRSSEELLKNIYVPGSADPGLAPALELSRSILSGEGATRPHGGGFAGTIQAFVPDEMITDYKKAMEKYYGPGSVRILRIK